MVKTLLLIVFALLVFAFVFALLPIAKLAAAPEFVLRGVAILGGMEREVVVAAAAAAVETSK